VKHAYYVEQQSTFQTDRSIESQGRYDVQESLLDVSKLDSSSISYTPGNQALRKPDPSTGSRNILSTIQVSCYSAGLGLDNKIIGSSVS